MTKQEFIKKYPIADYKIKAVGSSLKETLVRIAEIDAKYAEDLNEVIKDELDKFKAGIPEWDKFKYTPKEYIEVIQSYLNSTK